MDMMKVLQALEDYRRTHHRSFDGTILLPVALARDLDEDAQRTRQGGNLHSGLFTEKIIKSELKAGDTFQIWGKPCMAVDNLDYDRFMFVPLPI